jgi:hypothetical protein
MWVVYQESLCLIDNSHIDIIYHPQIYGACQFAPLNISIYHAGIFPKMPA